MTKYELTEKLMDRLVDPWTDCPEDYEDATPITLSEAKSMLQIMLQDDEAIDDPDFRVPEGTTPELLMEVYNCNLRKNQRELHVERLADWLTENECVCEYDSYRTDYQNNGVIVLPTDWLFNTESLDDFPFAFKDADFKPDIAMYLEMGMRSAKTLNLDDPYCWYDKDQNVLHSSDTPFADGVIEADKFAEFMLSPEGHDCLEYFLLHIMDDDEVRKVFGYDRQTVCSLYHI